MVPSGARCSCCSLAYAMQAQMQSMTMPSLSLRIDETDSERRARLTSIKRNTAGFSTEDEVNNI